MAEENRAEFFNELNVPFAKTLGAKITLAVKSRIEAELEVREELCTIPPTLHGGAVMAFADNLGALGAVMNMPEGAATTTVESKTNFLRPAPVGEKVRAVTTPVKLGRRIQVWETRISRDDGKLVAVVTQTQLVTEAAT